MTRIVRDRTFIVDAAHASVGSILSSVVVRNNSGPVTYEWSGPAELSTMGSTVSVVNALFPGVDYLHTVVVRTMDGNGMSVAVTLAVIYSYPTDGLSVILNSEVATFGDGVAVSSRFGIPLNLANRAGEQLVELSVANAMSVGVITRVGGSNGFDVSGGAIIATSSLAMGAYSVVVEVDAVARGATVATTEQTTVFILVTPATQVPNIDYSDDLPGNGTSGAPYVTGDMTIGAEIARLDITDVDANMPIVQRITGPFGVGRRSVTSAGTQLHITVASALVDGTTYEVTLNIDVTDRAGEPYTIRRVHHILYTTAPTPVLTVQSTLSGGGIQLMVPSGLWAVGSILGTVTAANADTIISVTGSTSDIAIDGTTGEITVLQALVHGRTYGYLARVEYRLSDGRTGSVQRFLTFRADRNI